MKHLGKQNGMSLVELLIAAAISLFLITSIFTVYLSHKKTYQYNQSLSYIQENSRLAFLSLTHDIHMARAMTYLPAENALQLTILTPDTSNHLSTIKYYLAKDQVNGKTISVLFRKEIEKPLYHSGLIDNVDNIKFVFYTKINPTHEYTASTIHDWSQVIGTKIILGLSSEDRRVHRELSLVIALRNPLV